MLGDFLGIATPIDKPTVGHCFRYFLSNVWSYSRGRAMPSYLFDMYQQDQFQVPGNWRTTRRPFVSRNPARSTTPPTRQTTTRPPTTIVRTNLGSGQGIPEGVKVSNRDQRLQSTSTGGNQFNFFPFTKPRTEVHVPNGPTVVAAPVSLKWPTNHGPVTTTPNYVETTPPDTTEIYSFFGTPEFNVLNSSVYANEANPSVSYSTVIVQGQTNPKPTMTFHAAWPKLHFLRVSPKYPTFRANI